MTYENDEGDLHIVKKPFLLGMQKVYRVCPLKYMGLFKITIKSDEFVGNIFRQLVDGNISFISLIKVSAYFTDSLQ